jgi:exosortase K
MMPEPNQIKDLVLQNAIFYLLALLIAIGLKYHYSRAGSEELIWILGPTAKLVEHIGGIPFESEAGAGFVNHKLRVIIAPACAGVNFLIIAFCTAVFSGLYNFKRIRAKIVWLTISLLSAYVLTIPVNALRILLSIYVYDADIYSGWLTAQRVHRLEGVVIYFFFLCLFYRIIMKATHHYLRTTAKKRVSGFQWNLTLSGDNHWVRAGLIPLFWYGLITLGIPLINAAYGKNGFRFIEHSGMVICGCLMVVAAIFLIQSGWQGIKKLILRWF